MELLENKSNVDAIILGFEGFHEEVASIQLSEIGVLQEVKCFNWRDLISEL